MKKFLRRAAYLAVGIAMGALGALAPRVVAATTTRQAEVFYRDIKLNLNGAELPIKDADGKAVEPVILFDTVYVPAKPLAAALGKMAIYDGSTLFIRKAPNDGTMPVKLGEFAPVKTDGNKFAELGDVKETGKTYMFDAIGYSSSGTGSRDYNLAGKCVKISGDLFIASSNTDSFAKVEFWADERLLYENTVRGGQKAVHTISF